MLFKILDNLRAKPKHVRDQYALGFSILVTFVIGGVWTLSLPSRFAETSSVAAVASSTNAAPFANFMTQFKNQFFSVKEIIETLPVDSKAPVSAASSTQAALDLQLSDENKEAVNASSTNSNYNNKQFEGVVESGAKVESSSQTILIATSSATTSSAI